MSVARLPMEPMPVADPAPSGHSRRIVIMGKNGRRSPSGSLLTEPRKLRKGKVASIPKLAARLNTTPYKLNKRLTAAGLLDEPNRPSQLALRQGYCQLGVGARLPLGGYWVWKIGMVTEYLREYDRERWEEWVRIDEEFEREFAALAATHMRNPWEGGGPIE